ncbi:hypothetical protein LTR70_004678 [Exophiala xenobiotica]|uniref:Uncharacterized protein n=1 Tax=Lithohypha guttulata TaxID=1690604 RepID=A0ABR0KCK8_9EURO|nr:hypothetical protein LTR24_004201 [Lithohypha guttulata]KAK5320315.1 hypothetical protein LTR70_004678 [Exophiala xenobiotica]
MAKAEWKCIAEHDDLQRSSHVVSVIGRTAYIFGGELVPREPRDNKMFSTDLNGDDATVNATESSPAPSPRVGSASTTLNGRVYLFSGRGGTAMAPIDEAGGVWEYDPSGKGWSLLNQADKSAPCPPARSYHCMTSDRATSIFLHAGCPESGRLSDLWCFNVQEKKWTQLAEAPKPDRGGTSVCFFEGCLYRMNGFDGKTEQGGSLDVYDIKSDSWSTKDFSADGESGPEARSVAALLPVNVQGKQMLMTLFGEHDPSSLGHAGAGKMLGNWWLYDIREDKWLKGGSDSASTPAPRGWFDADVVDQSKIVVAGGLSETNERLKDVWVLSF